jgi:hypothetical protein
MNVDTRPAGEVVLLTGVRSGIDRLPAWDISPTIGRRTENWSLRHVWREYRCLENGRMVWRQPREGERIDSIDKTQ